MLNELIAQMTDRRAALCACAESPLQNYRLGYAFLMDENVAAALFILQTAIRRVSALKENDADGAALDRLQRVGMVRS